MGRTSMLANATAYLGFLSAQLMYGQAPAAAPPLNSESAEVRHLNETVALQAEKLSSQSKQLAAQQAEIDALRSAFAEQKAALDKLLHPVGAAPAVQTAAVPAALPSQPVEGANAPPQPSEAASSSLLRREQREQPYVKDVKHWYDKYSIRGYFQMRDNTLLDTNTAYTCDQCDKSIGANQNLFIRRARLVISGNISDHVAFYLQPDFASSSGSGAGSQNYAQLRDFYFDISFDKEKENRIRVGQSKIPFGFESLQSSQNRLDFDRSDAINSAFANERDLGVFYYWAPAYIRARFNELVSSGLKGSGDYGAFGAGLFNGQILNSPSVNKYLHYVARYTYPFKLRNGQFIEASVQGYTGKFSVVSRSTNTLGSPGFIYTDQRVAGSLIIYPQPWGFQTEYNWGRGPQYNPQTKFIDTKQLNGGYALLNYRWPLPKGVVLIPYVRFQYYDGGKKQEIDARKYLIKEGDMGTEMQFGKYIELTPQFQYGYRLFEDGAKPNNEQIGALFRLQLQLNF